MPDQMTIAYITSQYARASDTFIRAEVLELRRRGHTVHTFSIRRADEGQNVSDEVRSEQASTDYILSHGAAALLISFIAVALTWPGRTLGAMRLAWKTRAPGLKALTGQLAYLIEAAYLARRLRKLGVSVIHNHIAENSATVTMLASQISGVPFSMTVHGPGIFYHPVRWALGEKIHRASFTACISSFCRSQCMAFSDPADWSKLKLVRCGLDRGFLNVERTPIPEAPRLVCVGRLCPEKGQLLLAAAVARHIEGGGRCELDFVGDGPSRGAIEKFIAEHGLEDSVRILGWRNSEEVKQEIKRSRALVLASFAEGLPVVIMEAMALGRPVITTSIAGIPELVENGVTGWLVPAGCIDSLTAAIGEAATASISRLTEMGRNGAERVAELHDGAKEVDKLETMFLQVAGGMTVEIGVEMLAVSQSRLVRGGGNVHL